MHHFLGIISRCHFLVLSVTLWHLFFFYNNYNFSVIIIISFCCNITITFLSAGCSHADLWNLWRGVAAGGHENTFPSQPPWTWHVLPALFPVWCHLWWTVSPHQLCTSRQKSSQSFLRLPAFTWLRSSENCVWLQRLCRWWNKGGSRPAEFSWGSCTRHFRADDTEHESKLWQRTYWRWRWWWYRGNTLFTKRSLIVSPPQMLKFSHSFKNLWQLIFLNLLSFFYWYQLCLLCLRQTGETSLPDVFTGLQQLLYSAGTRWVASTRTASGLR